MKVELNTTTPYKYIDQSDNSSWGVLYNGKKKGDKKTNKGIIDKILLGKLKIEQ
jgi:hypothetical protein